MLLAAARLRFSAVGCVLGVVAECSLDQRSYVGINRW
jgi:hypothetical protein